MFHDGAAKTVMQNVVFNRADDVDASRKKFERAGVHWFDPARVDERDRNSFFFELACRFFGDFKHVAQSEDRHIASVLHDLRLTYLEKLRFRFNFCAGPRTARITNGNRAGVVVQHRPEHIDEFIFVLRPLNPARSMHSFTFRFWMAMS